MVEKVQPFIYQSTHLYIAVRPGLMHVNLLLLGNYAVLHRNLELKTTMKARKTVKLEKTTGIHFLS